MVDVTAALEYLDGLRGWGGWGTTAVALAIWWKGLPPLIRVWNERADKVAEHTGKEIDRLERQIQASDDRHAECMEGQKELRREIDSQRKVIDGLIRQMRQMQISAIRLGSGPPNDMDTVTAKLIAELDQIPSGDLPKQ